MNMLVVRLQIGVGAAQLADEFGKVDRLQRQIAEQGLVVAEGVLDEAIHALAGCADAAQALAAGLGESRRAFLFDDFGKAAHGAQRGAHIVDNGVGKAP